MMDCERRGLVTTENITALQSQLQESEELTHACEELENQEEVEEEQDGEPPSQSDEEADDSPEITQLEEVSVQLSISTYRASDCCFARKWQFKCFIQFHKKALRRAQLELSRRHQS